MYPLFCLVRHFCGAVKYYAVPTPVPDTPLFSRPLPLFGKKKEILRTGARLRRTVR